MSLAEQDRARGCEILANLAEEEAAKYLILIDAVRCPRDTPNFGRQLAKFNQHLAKGLYAESAMLSPVNFREVAQYMNRQRKELYLDRDGEMDWICRNHILQRRDTQMYVDYLRTESGHLSLLRTPSGYRRPSRGALRSISSRRSTESAVLRRMPCRQSRKYGDPLM